MGSEIIVCEKRFDIGHKVVTFEDEGGYNAYLEYRTDNIGEIFASHPARGLERRAKRFRARRSMGRSRTLARLRQVARQFVVHLDGLRNARQCFNVLHNERGLSVHFMVDNDGTIYQTLDLVDCAFHAGGVNEVSVGVELQNRGDAHRFPNYYPKGQRKVVTCSIHGHQFLAYDFTAAQYQAMIKLCQALNKILGIPLVVPQVSGDPVWSTISNPRRFKGYLGHYHIERQKWDPGPWDFQRMFRAVGSKVTFPLTRLPRGRRPRKEKEDDKKFRKDAEQHYEASEGTVGAYFPVGPLGRSRLWHGGVHLAAAERTPLYAPLMGQMVAARMAPGCPVGSCNFILMRHQLASHLGQRTFFSLYFHLMREEDTQWIKDIVPWLIRTRKATWRPQLELGRVALMHEEVEAGELIGHVGSAGPAGHRSSQIHFEIFSARDITRGLDDGKERFWEQITSTGRGRLCENPALIERIDEAPRGKKGDGLLTRRELRQFFRYNPRRQHMRRLAVRHRSEWTPGGWEDELARAADFAALPAKERQRLLAQQIKPTLWWTPALAAHAGLPADGMVHSYHPVGFLVWFRRLVHRSASLRSIGIGSEDKWAGKPPPDTFKLDGESSDGVADEEDFHSGDAGQKLTLEDLVDGYPKGK